MHPPKLSTPNEGKYHWTQKGSYRLELLLEIIKNLSNCFNMFSHENFPIYVLDNNNVHSMPEVRQAL